MFRSICCSPCRTKQSSWAGVADASGSSQQLLFKLCFCLYKTRCKYCEGFYDINPCCFRLKSFLSIILRNRADHALGANHPLRSQILALIMGLSSCWGGDCLWQARPPVGLSKLDKFLQLRLRVLMLRRRISASGHESYTRTVSRSWGWSSTWPM